MARPASQDTGPIISARDLRVGYGDREVLHGLDVRRSARRDAGRHWRLRFGKEHDAANAGGAGKAIVRDRCGSTASTSPRPATREMDAIRKRIGLAFQGGALIGSMSVGGNIALPLLEHTTLAPHHHRGNGAD